MRLKNAFLNIIKKHYKSSDFVRNQDKREIGTTIYYPFVRISTDR